MSNEKQPATQVSRRDVHGHRRHRCRDHDRAAPRARRRRVPGAQRHRQRRRRRLHPRHGHVEPDQRGEERQHRRAVRPRRERGRQGGPREARDARELAEGGPVQGLPRHAREAEGHRRGARRDAGSQARPDRHGRDAAGQARLRAEAADAHDQRGPGAHRSGAEVQGRHADGQPGPLGRGPAPDAGVARRRRDRPGARGALLDQPADLAAGHAAADRDAGGARRPGLGHVDRPRADAPVPQDLPPVRLARVAGLRRRRDGRHGLSRPGRGVHDPEARRADQRHLDARLQLPAAGCPASADSASASSTTTAIRRRRSSTCRSRSAATCRR